MHDRRDVTAKSEWEKELRELDIFFDITPDLLCITRTDGLFLKVNKAWKDILGYECDEIEGSYAVQFVHPEDAAKLEQTIKEIQEEASHPEFLQYINRYRHKDGSYRYIEWNTRLFENKYYCIAREVTDRILRQQQIEHLSYHDPLTGLYNRRFCEEEIKRIDTDRNLPVTIIMGDMNRLKLMNDTFGHDQGDEYIRETADAIKTGCRPDDIIARWGGDEFIILLPRTSEADARKIVDRILKFCENRQVNGIQVSTAFGLASKTSPSESLADIMKEAEKDMYHSKAMMR